METITRPSTFVKYFLGKKPLLIYGNVEGEEIVLYANEHLPEYELAGDVFVKRLACDHPFVEKSRRHLAYVQAYTYPRMRIDRRHPHFRWQVVCEERPSETVRNLFGVDSSFGYAPSVVLADLFYIGRKTRPSSPPDIKLSHEGAHAVSINEMKQFLPKYYHLIDPCITDKDMREQVLVEAIAMVIEKEYIDCFCPTWRSWYEKFRKNDGFIEYQEAHRLVQEEQRRMKELVFQIRDINLKK